VRTIRTIEHPNGRHRIEFYRRGDGTFGYRQSEMVRKRWRRSDQTEAEFAAAVVYAAEATGWLANALQSSTDWRQNYHLELSRGLTFRFAVYEEHVFGDHAHCLACSAKFAQWDWPDVQHEGCVTRYHVPDGSGRWQWNWVCAQCFQDLRAQLDWQLEPRIDESIGYKGE
jgi:hypothetical protein